MSYRMHQSTSYGRMRRYVAQVVGGLESREATRELAAAWRALQAEIVSQRAAREDGDDVLLASSARARVEDAEWDEALLAVSSRAYELARKDAAADPYATLFGRVDAKRARSFGLAKATAVGRQVVKDGRRLEPEGLAGPLDRLEAATARLEVAHEALEAAEDALFSPRLAKKKLIKRLDQLIATTEASVLMAFPGRDDIVKAILVPWFERRRGKGGAGAEPDPLVPDLDDEDEDLGGGPTP